MGDPEKTKPPVEDHPSETSDEYIIEEVKNLVNLPDPHDTGTVETAPTFLLNPTN